MARGTLFELEQDPEMLGNANDNSFYEYAGFEFDYVVMASDPETEIQQFVDMIRSYGMETGAILYQGRTIHFVEITQAGKEAYFSSAFHELKKRAKSMTLEYFATDQAAWALRSCVDDTYGDAVTSQDDEFQSLDRFMRNAFGRFYIGNVMYMH